MNLYRASKLLANKATWDFVKDKKPHFSVVTINPTFVWGYNITQTTPDIQGTNRMLWFAIKAAVIPGFNNFVNVHDVADAHLKALDESVEGNQEFLVSAPNFGWGQVKEFVDKKWPGLSALKGSEVSGAWNLDTGKAERKLGMKWRSLEETVTEVVEQQLGFETRV
jgi:nucleoside-diphosphate-sugar epimerase